MRHTILLFALSLGLVTTVIGNPLPEEGRTIFSSRCAGCHNVNKQLTGPALAGVSDRRSADWIVSFVQSSQSLIKGGDKDAIALFHQFNRIPMPDHKDLTADNIKNVIEYIKSTTVSTAGEDVVPFAKPTSLRPNYLPLTINDYGFYTIYLGLVGLLIASLLFLVRTKELERTMNKK